MYFFLLNKITSNWIINLFKKSFASFSFREIKLHWKMTTSSLCWQEVGTATSLFTWSYCDQVSYYYCCYYYYYYYYYYLFSQLFRAFLSELLNQSEVASENFCLSLKPLEVQLPGRHTVTLGKYVVYMRRWDAFKPSPWKLTLMFLVRQWMDGWMVGWM